MGQVFRTRRFVEFADTDMAGIAHFSAFFRWMEEAEHELLRSFGLSVFKKFDDGAGHAVGLPRVSATCDYKSPAKCEETLDIAVTVERLGEKSATYAFEFTVDGREVARGKMTGVCCRMVEGARPEPTKLPTEFVDALRPYSDG